jgi:hypothetical protein
MPTRQELSGVVRNGTKEQLAGEPMANQVRIKTEMTKSSLDYAKSPIGT